jgi:two-component system, NarL family, response regulator NreC
VLDLGLKDGSGLDAIAEVCESGARAVVLSMQNEPAYARKAFELGAQGYVIKDAAGDELASASDIVLDDRIYVHAEMAARLVMRDPEDDLTERERQILRLIALGYANQEIAGQLYLSVRTIRGAPPSHPRQASPLDARRTRALRTRAAHRGHRITVASARGHHSASG